MHDRRTDTHSSPQPREGLRYETARRLRLAEATAPEILLNASLSLGDIVIRWGRVRHETSRVPGQVGERMSAPDPFRLVVGVTGATGAALAVRLLERLRELPGLESHLIISAWARSTIRHETGLRARDVAALADHTYHHADQAAAIASGSFRTEGMVVIPCSMKTLAAIRLGYADGLIARAADVTLKERRRLVLVTRETPLSDVHLDNMLAVSRSGAIVFPPVLGFYHLPHSLDEALDHLVARLMDQFDLPTPGARRWAGIQRPSLMQPSSPLSDDASHDPLQGEPR